jgi:hypothetical protein
MSNKYQEWVLEQTHVTWEREMLVWHEKIWQFHCELEQLKIPHLFFNAYSDFSSIRNQQITTHATDVIPNEYHWGNSYVAPYQSEMTYFNWLKSAGFDPVNPKSYHYGADAHRAWAEFLYQNYVSNILTNLE